MPQHFWRQIFHRYLARLEVHKIRFPGVFDQGRVVYLKLPGGRHKAGTHIAKRIFVLSDRHRRGNPRFIGFSQVRAPRRMHMEQGDHGNCIRNLELNVKTKTDQHRQYIPFHNDLHLNQSY